jgi:site-specific DNA recombinase
VSGPAKAFREVVSAVIVDLRQAGEKYQYEIKGWLSAIAGDELSVALMITEDRYHQLQRA